MDVILPVFVAILLAETDGAFQNAAHRLAGRFSARTPIYAALALVTLINLSIGGIGGALIAQIINFQSRSLIAGLALLFAGAPMLIALKPSAPVTGTRPFWTSVGIFTRAQLGGASQFIVFAFAARTDMAALALGGGMAAMLIIATLPLLLDQDWPSGAPMVLLRRLAAVILIITGFWMILAALRIL